MEELKDPKKDRMVKALPPPPQRPLASHLVFKENNEVDWVVLRDHLKKEGRVAQADVIKLIDLVSFIVSTYSNHLRK
jgi:serine/threonine-protein phosphatase 2B catalytic subunit